MSRLVSAAREGPLHRRRVPDRPVDPARRQRPAALAQHRQYLPRRIVPAVREKKEN